MIFYHVTNLLLNFSCGSRNLSFSWLTSRFWPNIDLPWLQLTLVSLNLKWKLKLEAEGPWLDCEGNSTSTCTYLLVLILIYTILSAYFMYLFIVALHLIVTENPSKIQLNHHQMHRQRNLLYKLWWPWSIFHHFYLAVPWIQVGKKDWCYKQQCWAINSEINNCWNSRTIHLKHHKVLVRARLCCISTHC